MVIVQVPNAIEHFLATLTQVENPPHFGLRVVCDDSWDDDDADIYSDFFEGCKLIFGEYSANELPLQSSSSSSLGGPAHPQMERCGVQCSGCVQ